MKYIISRKKVDLIYSEINKEIMDLRISLKGKVSSDIDFNIAQAHQKIWNRLQPILSKKEK